MPSETGYRDFSYGFSGNTTPTGEKPQSKLWWNDGWWWGVLYDDASEAYRIYRLDTAQQAWVDCGTQVDERGSSKSDVLWDAATGKLYVASHVFNTKGQPNPAPANWARLYRFSYLPIGPAYALDAGFPVPISQGVAEALTLAKDSTGRLWATWVESSRVLVNHSLSDDAAWAAPFVLPVDPTSVEVASDDISAVIAFGGDRLGVLWSNQLAARTHFAVHLDGDAPAVWQAVETVVPDAQCWGACSDDHISLKAAPDGRVLAALKTGLTAPADPLVLVSVRAPGGGWSSSVFGTVAEHHTRPILQLDQDAQRVYIFASHPESGGCIHYKSAPLDSLLFAPGIGLPFIQSALDPRVNNATSAKQNVDGATNLLVLACDKDSHFYLHNLLDL